MFSDTCPFKGVHVCVAITNWHDRSCGEQHEKIIQVQREKIISVQPAKNAMWLRAQRVEAVYSAGGGEAGLAKPMVKRRVPELAETIIATLHGLEIADPVAEAVAALIRQRCERARSSFRD